MDIRCSRILSSRTTAAILAASLVGIASPAAAHVDSCVGTGTMSLDRGLYYLPDYKYNVNFSVTLTGFCVSAQAGIALDGVLSQASCDNAYGSGGGDHHSFTVVNVGGVWHFTGGVNGSFLGIPQGSCLDGGAGASSFLLVGEATLL